MPVGVELRTSSDQVLESYNGGYVNELAELALRDPARFPLLSGVDPYDDTAFNSLQCIRLSEELTVIAGLEGTSQLAGVALHLKQLADRLNERQTGLRASKLVFTGD